MSTSQKPSCFVISPIGESGSETRKRSDKVLAHVFEAALSEAYKVTRADKISEPGMITSQILRALQDSDLVIADLTEHNANVFYELAVRHAVEKPVIHVIDSRWKIPFDVAGFRTIVFDFTDLDSVADAIKQLKQQASDVRSGKQGETPIKLANLMRRSTQDPENTVLLKEAVEGITMLRVHIAELSGQMNEQFNRVEGPLGTRYYAGVVPGVGGKLVGLSTLLNPKYSEGLYGIDLPGGALFQVPPGGTSDTLAAQTQFVQATQPDQVPTHKKPHATIPIRRRRPLIPRSKKAPEKKQGES